MPILQELLHKLEWVAACALSALAWPLLAVLVLTGLYDWRAFRNMATQEAMDAAQLARNIAQGKGYTTLFIRPLSIRLVKQRNLEKRGVPEVGKAADLAELRGMHPDLANPPLYPVVLAGLMKVLPFDYAISRSGEFSRFGPDFLIALFNQLLFLVVIVLVFFLAGRLFDPWVAWLSSGLLLGTELFWRFSVSGLSTMLLMVIFLGLAWCLVLLEQETRTPKWGPFGILILAGLTGVMVGLGGLTRYSFGWLILPVLMFLILFGGQRRLVLGLIALAAFTSVMAPWIARNYSVSGRPFGTASYAVVENTVLYPENRLERSLEPDLHPPDAARLYPIVFWLKLSTNLRRIVASELPKLGGSWVTAFFLVGLLVGFRNPGITRLRYFLLACVVVLALVQALGRTQLSEESPELNSENLLVLLAPLVLVYGVSLFLLLLDQMQAAVSPIAVSRHWHFQPDCLPADVSCFPAPPRPSDRLPALLPARHPDGSGVAEGKGTGHERHPLGDGVVRPAPMRLVDAEVHP